jgi:hypothetical protein
LHNVCWSIREARDDIKDLFDRHNNEMKRRADKVQQALQPNHRELGGREEEVVQGQEGPSQEMKYVVYS